MKNLIWVIAICLLSGCTIIFFAFHFSKKWTIQPEPAFERNFSALNAGYDAINIQYNSYYIAGLTTSHIYLANVTDPLHILRLDTNLQDSLHIKIKVKPHQIPKVRYTRVQIDSPFFYMTEGTSPVLFKGKMSDWEADQYMSQSAFFSACRSIDSNACIIRTIQKGKNEYVLGKETESPPALKISSTLLQKQIDGLFCTDGHLLYNAEQKFLVYVYFYRNQFICFDTNLDLIYNGHTLDTISKAQITVARIGPDNTFTLSSPPLLVNRQSYTSGNSLFINANLMGKNEDPIAFKNVSVIDVYDITNGDYNFSFYIFDRNEENVNSFAVKDNKVFTIQGHFVYAYTMNDRF